MGLAISFSLQSIGHRTSRCGCGAVLEPRRLLVEKPEVDGPQEEIQEAKDLKWKFHLNRVISVRIKSSNLRWICWGRQSFRRKATRTQRFRYKSWEFWATNRDRKRISLPILRKPKPRYQRARIQLTPWWSRNPSGKGVICEELCKCNQTNTSSRLSYHQWESLVGLICVAHEAVKSQRSTSIQHGQNTCSHKELRIRRVISKVRVGVVCAASLLLHDDVIEPVGMKIQMRFVTES